MIEIYETILGIKKIKRHGWMDRGLDADTIAAHSYGAEVLGWIIAEQEKVDSSKVIKMLAIHDLVMAEMEDVTPSSGRYQYKRKLEEEAKQRVALKMPEVVREEYLILFDEFNAQKTRESQIARDADKLETLLQGLSFERETGREDVLDEFLVTYADVFNTETGKRVFEEIKEKHSKM